MFDMNKQKKTIPSWEFDMENDIKDPAKRKALHEQIHTRIQQLKKILREGENKEVFDQTQTLLHGYLAMKKVVERSQKQMTRG